MGSLFAFFTIFCFLQYGSFATSSGDNVLEVGKCILSAFQGSIESERTVHSDSSSILQTLETRSLLDCVDQCMSLRMCYGALYTEEGRRNNYNRGKCVLLDVFYDSQDCEGAQGQVLTGNFVSLTIYDSSPTGGDSCQGVSCASGASCYTMCDQSGDYTPYPYCIAENTDCDQDEEFTNIRHYYGSYSEGANDGIVQYVTYDKQREDTWIRIIWHTSFRGHYDSPGNCHYWYVLFDGSECSSPTNIARYDYSATTGDSHRAETLDGTCYNIAKGSRRLDFRIARCPNYADTDGHTGYLQGRQLIVMEIVPRTQAASKPCPGMSVFNYQYKADMTSTGQQGYGTTVFSDTYRKAASDTNIRIKFQATMRVQQIGSVHACGRCQIYRDVFDESIKSSDQYDSAQINNNILPLTPAVPASTFSPNRIARHSWAIYVDGSECSPQGDITMNLNSHGNPDYHRDELKGYTIEAVCQSLGIGDHTIDIRTVACYYASSEEAHFHTGWQSGMRMHIEEIRQSQRLDAVLTNDRRVLRSPISNVYRWHAWLWNNGEDNNELTYFTYTKLNDWTGMRLTASGSHRTIYYPNSSPSDPCSRWWFQIDNQECSDPGPIEGIDYFNYEANYHRPMQVTGVCLGRTSGSYRISYHIGMCAGHSHYGEGYTGSGSSFHIIVEEIAFEETKTCASTSPMNCDN